MYRRDESAGDKIHTGRIGRRGHDAAGRAEVDSSQDGFHRGSSFGHGEDVIAVVISPWSTDVIVEHPHSTESVAVLRYSPADVENAIVHGELHPPDVRC